MNRQRQLFHTPRPALPPPERWTITFVGHATGVPVVCRVKRLLKTAWRGYGLRATTVTGLPATTAPPLESLAATAPPSPGRPSVPTGTNEASHARLIAPREEAP